MAFQNGYQDMLYIKRKLFLLCALTSLQPRCRGRHSVPTKDRGALPLVQT
jgi:hypothetical protein